MMDPSFPIINIKKEKIDDGYEKQLLIAESLPKPILVKTEVENPEKEIEQSLSDNIIESAILKIKQEPTEHQQNLNLTSVTVEKEIDESLSDNIIESAIFKIKQEPTEHQPNLNLTSVAESSPIIQNTQTDEEFDELNCLDEIIKEAFEETPIDLNEDIDSVSRIEIEDIANKRRKENDDESSNSILKIKKHKKESKKREASTSPVDLKPDLKKLKEALASLTEPSITSNDKDIYSDDEYAVPRKIYNYNHSSLSGIANDKEINKNVSRDTDVSRMVVVKCFSPKKELENETLNKPIKYSKVLKNCKKVLKRFKFLKSTPYCSRFCYTPTKLVLPTEDIAKENRSPLLRSYNVQFSFSSNNSVIRYNEFHIESCSDNIAKVCKVLGLDISILKDFMNNSGSSSQSRKESVENIDRKPFKDVPQSTFLTSTSTQTDIPCNICLKRSISSKHNVETQVNFESYETGKKQASLPILRMIENLNANQLLALNDFAILMCEQNWDRSDSATRFDVREKILKYFQEGQHPCNVRGMSSSLQPVHVPAQVILPMNNEMYPMHNNRHAVLNHKEMYNNPNSIAPVQYQQYNQMRVAPSFPSMPPQHNNPYPLPPQIQLIPNNIYNDSKYKHDPRLHRRRHEQ